MNFITSSTMSVSPILFCHPYKIIKWIFHIKYKNHTFVSPDFLFKKAFFKSH